MFINRRKQWRSHTLAVALWAGLASAPLYAQQVDEPDSWQANQGIDLFMDTLHGPILQPVWFTPADDPAELFGSPIYKQQPPVAQEDFRPPPPKPTPKPEPKPAPKQPQPAPQPAPPPVPEPCDPQQQQCP